jgi:hypothetical protein
LRFKWFKSFRNNRLLYATEVNALHGRDGLRVLHSTGAFCTLYHKRTGEGALATSIALDSDYSRQIGDRLRANQVHDGMAFRQGGIGRSATRLRPLQPKQELSCLTSIFLDVGAAVSKETG